MKARRALLLCGSLWELVRFFLVLLLFAAVLQDASGASPSWVLPWLLVVGSGNLLIAAGGGMLAWFPDRYGQLISFLRLGKVLSIFSFVMLLVSGGLRIASGHILLGAGRFAVTGGTALLGVCVLDMLFLVVLMGWHGEQDTGEQGRPGASTLPDEVETEVRDFH